MSDNNNYQKEFKDPQLAISLQETKGASQQDINLDIQPKKQSNNELLIQNYENKLQQQQQNPLKGSSALIRSFVGLKQSLQLNTTLVKNSIQRSIANDQQPNQYLQRSSVKGSTSNYKDPVYAAKLSVSKAGEPAMPPPLTEQQKDPLKPEFHQKQQNAEEKFRQMDDHKIPLDDLFARLQSSIQQGLTQQMAHQRNLELGDNKLTEKKKTPWWIRLIMEMLNWFSIMLWVGAALCILAYELQTNQPSNLYLGIILIFVILLTGFITYQQTAKSEALMESFKNFLPQQCIVIRDGTEVRILAEKLVPGDMVIVKMGDKIPADIRITQSGEMKVDNSALTGEVDPLLRKVECTHPDNPLETANMAFFGTLCKEGRGRGIVVRIGDNTVLGQIADLAASGEKVKTPLRKELDRFVLFITVIAVVLGVSFYLLGQFAVGYDYIDCIVFGIGILVANVPEGLLGCVTVSLAITASRLAKKQVLVKNLEGVETLGSTSCICSDKTGTLTQNKMTVEHVWYDGLKRKALNRQKHGPGADYEYDVSDPSFQQLRDCAVISSECRFDLDPQADLSKIIWLDAKTIGDASETGLVKFFQPIEDIEVTRKKYKIVLLPDGQIAKMPFNSTNKYALSIVEYQTNDSCYCIYIKGAPEKVWKFCSQILINGRMEQINEEWEAKFQQVNLNFGKGGERVLGFAKLHLPLEQFPKGTVFNISSPENFNFPMKNFQFVGLISMIDPPKDSVPFAVLKCRSAGIKVIMVTGDQPPTAGAIARQVNIIPKNVKTVDDILEENPQMTWDEAAEKAQALVIHGDRINQAIEDEMLKGKPEDEQDMKIREWVQKPYVVFARTTPAQKLKIVRACQRVGYIVGVTGDGVNDSPAIKQGDIGISMGISGSDVTKDAADMILLNDDFASIVDGIEEGRKIFDNLKKTIVYLLTSNITQIIPFLAFIIVTIPLPLSAVFMLVICIGTDILPAISLAYEDAELDVMTRRPRKKEEHMITVKLITHAYGQMGMIATAAGFFAYYMVMFYYGFTMTGLFGIAIMPTIIRPQIISHDHGVTNYEPYDQGQPTLGNSNLWPYVGIPCKNNDPNSVLNQVIISSSDTSEQLDWIGNNDMTVDLRQQLIGYNCATGWFYTLNLFRECQYQSGSESLSLLDNSFNDDISSSPISKTTICYTTEALKYAQTAYFVAVVFIQWSNIFTCKSKKQSIIHSGFNEVMIYGILCETSICLLLCYIPGIDSVFGARPLEPLMFGGPGFIFSMMLLIWDEVRKFLIRNGKKKPGQKLSWFEDNLHW